MELAWRDLVSVPFAQILGRKDYGILVCCVLSVHRRFARVCVLRLCVLYINLVTKTRGKEAFSRIDGTHRMAKGGMVGDRLRNL